MVEATLCTTSSLEWTALILTIFTTNVSWWLFDIPLLWQYGFRQYMSSVIWQCFRLHMPSCAAIYAIMAARNSAEEPFIYYSGPFYNAISRDFPEGQRSPPRLTRFGFVKALTLDTLTVISTIVTIYNACQLPEGTDIHGLNSSLWMFPSLPVAVIGLWLLLCSVIKWRRRWTILLGLLMICVVGVALALPLALVSAVTRPGNLWIASVVGYVMIALPVAIWNNLWMVLLCAAYGVLFRVCGLGAAALAESGYFPFCQLRSSAFGGVYIGFGVLAAILAVWGRYTIFETVQGSHRQAHGQAGPDAAYQQSKPPHQLQGASVDWNGSDNDPRK
ncbi:hypothetical protein MFIFM68171_08204 [Madurella fahalii]|uniref:Uncharacterized protein n=1 Tax=Madurella fahalii TaxID=1157608 RepID=A0ABQ0GJQ6_9PEZI